MEEKTNDQKDSRGPSGRQRPDDGAGYGWYRHPSGGGNLVSTVSAAPAAPTLEGTLNLSKQLTSASNSEQGWSWEFDESQNKGTLTLDNCYIKSTVSASVISFPRNSKVTIILKGENIVETTLNNFSCMIGQDSVDITFRQAEGEQGSLSILGPGTSVDANDNFPYALPADICIQSGTIYTNTLFCMARSLTISGGSLTVDTPHVTGNGCGGLYLLNALNMTGGKLVINTGASYAIWVPYIPGTSGVDHCIYITGGDVDIKSTGFSFLNQDPNGANVYIYGGNIKMESLIGVTTTNSDIDVGGDANFTFVGSNIGFDTRGEDNTITVSGGTFDTSQVNEGFIPTRTALDNGANIVQADYSAIDALLAQVPSDLSGYDEASVTALQQVIAKIEANRNLDIFSQFTVDSFAAELRAALSNLIALPEEPAEDEDESETYLPSTPISDGFHTYSIGTMYYQDGKRVRGWTDIDGARYYFDEKGLMATGWKEIEPESGDWYHFGEDGALDYGWYKEGNVWYYLDPVTGLMYNDGLAAIDKSTYYFYDWGGMASDWWYEAEDGWYFFGGSGAMKAAQWLEWKGEWYYLTENGRMATDTTIGEYYVNADGVWVK